MKKNALKHVLTISKNCISQKDSTKGVLSAWRPLRPSGSDSSPRAEPGGRQAAALRGEQSTTVVIVLKKSFPAQDFRLPPAPGYDKIPPRLPLEKVYFAASRVFNSLRAFCGDMLREFNTARQPPLERARALLDETAAVLSLNYNALLGVMMGDLDGEYRPAHCVRTSILALLAGLSSVCRRNGRGISACPPCSAMWAWRCSRIFPTARIL